jgi:hypothetical protein
MHFMSIRDHSPFGKSKDSIIAEKITMDDVNTQEGGNQSSEWEEKFSEKHQKKYWRNKRTGESSWKNPIPSAPSQEHASATISADSGSGVAGAQSTTATSGGSDWEEKYSEKHKKKFWRNKVTGESSWKDPHLSSSSVTSPTPAAMAPTPSATDETKNSQSDWEEKYSEKHKKKFWKNRVTGESSWKDPNIVAASESASQLESSSVTVNPFTSESKSASHDWEEKYSEKHKKKFWKNKVTGESSWKDPAVQIASDAATSSAASSSSSSVDNTAVASNSDWEEKYSEKHKKQFWKNKVTGESSWKDPNLSSSSVTTPAVTPTPSMNEETKNSQSDWEEKYNEKHKRKFWRNRVTGENTWKDPTTSASSAVSPVNEDSETAVVSSPATDVSLWEEKFSAKHNRKFWKHKVTGESSWKDPTVGEALKAESGLKSIPPPPPPPPRKPNSVDGGSALSPILVKPRASLLLSRPQDLASATFLPLTAIVWLRESAVKWTCFQMIIQGSGFDLTIDLRPFKLASKDIVAGAAGAPKFSISVHRCKAIICNESSCQLKIMSAEVLTKAASISEKPFIRSSLSSTPRNSAFSDPLISPMRRSQSSRTNVRQLVSMSDDSEKGKIYQLRCMSYKSAQSIFLAIKRRLLHEHGPSLESSNHEESLELLKRTVFEDKSMSADDKADIVAKTPSLPAISSLTAHSLIPVAEKLTSALLLAEIDSHDLLSLYRENLQSIQATVKSLPKNDALGSEDLVAIARETTTQLEEMLRATPSSSIETKISEQQHLGERSNLEDLAVFEGMLYLQLQQQQLDSNSSHERMLHLPWSSYGVRLDSRHRKLHIHERSLSTRPLITLDLSRAFMSLQVSRKGDDDDVQMPYRYDFQFDGIFLSLSSGIDSSTSSPAYQLLGRCQSKFEYLQWSMMLCYLCYQNPNLRSADTGSLPRLLPKSRVQEMISKANEVLPSIHDFWSPTKMLTAFEHVCKDVAFKSIVQSSIAPFQLHGSLLRSHKFQIVSSSSSSNLSSSIIVSFAPKHTRSRSKSSSLSEGSMVVAVNAMSVLSTAIGVLIKYLEDIPKQELMNLLVIKYPREEYFHLDLYCSIIETSLLKKVSQQILSSNVAVTSSAAAIAAAVKAVKFDDLGDSSILPRSPTGKRSSFVLPIIQEATTSSLVTTADPFGKNSWIAASLRIANGMITIDCKSSSSMKSEDGSNDLAVDAVISMPIRKVSINLIYVPSDQDRDLDNKKNYPCSRKTACGGGIAIELVCRAAISAVDVGSDIDSKAVKDPVAAAGVASKENISSYVTIMHRDYHVMVDLVTSLYKACMIAGNIAFDVNAALESFHKYRNGDLFTKPRSSSTSSTLELPSLSAATASDSGIKSELLAAAEALQSSLSAFRFKSALPSLALIVERLRELKHQNSQNHLLLAEVLLLQADYRRKDNGKYLDYGYVSSKFFKSHRYRSSSFSSGSVLHRASILSSNIQTNHEEHDAKASAGDMLMKPRRGSTASSRSSVASLIFESPMLEDANELTASQSSGEKATTITQPVTASMLAPALARTNSKDVPLVNRALSSDSAAETSKEYKSINRPLFGLTDMERKSVYCLIDYLRTSPEAIVPLMLTMDADSQCSFARIMVTRLFNPLSADQTALLSCLRSILSQASPEVSSKFLRMFLEVIYRRSDVEGFLIKLCSDLIIPANLLFSQQQPQASASNQDLIILRSSVQQLTPANVQGMCANVIEPLFHRLLDAVVAGSLPTILRGILLLLSEPSSAPTFPSPNSTLTAMDVIFELLRRGIMRYFKLLNDRVKQQLQLHPSRSRPRSASRTSQSPSSPADRRSISQPRPSIVSLNKMKYNRLQKLGSSQRKQRGSGGGKDLEDAEDDTQDLLVEDELAVATAAYSLPISEDAEDDHSLSVSYFAGLDHLASLHPSANNLSTTNWYPLSDASMEMSMNLPSVFLAAIQKAMQLIHISLDQDGYTDHQGRSSLLCLSDAAALSRSKSLASTLSQLLLELAQQESAALRSVTKPQWSPVASIASLQPGSARPWICDSIVCMHVEELMLLLSVCCYETSGYQALVESYASTAMSPNPATPSPHSQTNARQTHAHSQVHPPQKEFIECLHWLQNAVEMKERLLSVIHRIVSNEPSLSSSSTATASKRVSSEELINNSISVLVYSEYAFHLPVTNEATSMIDSLIANHDVEISDDAAGACALAPIVWLLNACRDSIKSVYEINSNISADPRSSQAMRAKILELKQLRDSLESKAEVIRHSMMDMHRLELCSSLLGSIRQQLALLTIHYHELCKPSDNTASVSGTAALIDGSSSNPATSLANILAAQFDLESQLMQIFTSSSTAARRASSPELSTEHSNSRSKLSMIKPKANPLSMSISAIRQQEEKQLSEYNPPSPSQRSGQSQPQSNPLWMLMKNTHPSSPRSASASQ